MSRLHWYAYMYTHIHVSVILTSPSLTDIALELNAVELELQFECPHFIS